MKGTIKTLNREKGYGFIAVEGQSKDVFFHSTELSGVEFTELAEGDAVTFETMDSDRGPKATKVQRA